MKKKLINIILGSLLVLSLAGCNQAGNPVNETANTANTEVAIEAEEQVAAAEENTEAAVSICIVYTNDIHSYLYNTVTDENNEEKPGLRLSNVAAYVNEMRNEGKDVILVDAGDELQGDVYGAFDEGESIVQLINASGYQVATPGNNDFDYGMGTFFNRKEEADYPYISCNFHALEGEPNPLDASHIIEAGGKKIAFIGITTPETITSSTPAYFQNEKGEYIYVIDGIEDAKDMYESVQNAIDDVRADVDYVIALGHVGVGLDEVKNSISSYDVIKNVEGLDAFIDAHSHTIIEGESVKDKSGKDVLLTQTGSYLSNIGVMEIDGSSITTKLVGSYDNAEPNVALLEEEVHANLMDKMGEKIAVLGTPLYINDPENSKRRLIRSTEMNSGDMVSDSVYWYFNDYLELDCDIVMSNGGGIRAQVNKGDVTYLDVKSIEPFGNMVCLINATGQQILDALEMGANVIGEWDDDWDIPAENGGFMQVAGMKYSIDSTIPSSVKTLPDGMFVSVDGEYRVKDVEIYNRETGEYEALDVDKNYSVGGINYILRNSGNGLCMFNDNSMIIDYIGQDYSILAMYLQSFELDGDYPLVNTKNSPLSQYSGYALDYENPFGSGRITVIE